MTEIRIDGKRVFADKEQVIKLTVENPYYQKTGSYTLDITLPLAVEENRAVFGYISRHDVSKQPVSLPAEITVSGAVIVKGTATVTQVSEDAVKVQILGGQASYNFANKWADTYVDELDMPNWCYDTWRIEEDRDLPLDRFSKRLAERLKALGDAPYGDDILKFYLYSRPPHWELWEEGLPEEFADSPRPSLNGWVAYPVLNSETDDDLSDMYEGGANPGYQNNGEDVIWLNVPLYSAGVGTPEGVLPPVVNPSLTSAAARVSIPVASDEWTAQPYLWKICEMVAEATGYKLPRRYNRIFNSLYLSRIFLVNANRYPGAAASLPHWKVPDFWSNVENVCGVVMVIVGDEIRLLDRSTYYSLPGDDDGPRAERIRLDDVADEFEVTLSSKATATDPQSMNINVGFVDFPHDSWDLASDELRNQARECRDYSTLRELCEYLKDLSDEELTAERGTIWIMADDRRFSLGTTLPYARSGSGARVIVREIDRFRPRLGDETKTSLDVQLKIVPARNANLRAYARIPNSATPSVIEDLGVVVQGLKRPDIGAVRPEDIVVENVLKGEQQIKKEDKQDKLFIALRPEGMASALKVDSPTAFDMQYYRPEISSLAYATIASSGSISVHDEFPAYSLSLTVAGQRSAVTLGSTLQALNIDTRVVHGFDFLASGVTDPLAVYYIRGKRFICQKIEYEITERGLTPLARGYFYEVIPE